MCGRITQYRARIEYLDAIGWHGPPPASPEEEERPSWNVAPTTRPWLMHQFAQNGAQDGQYIERVRWGYRPDWAVEKGLPLAINARIEKAATGPFFRPLWKTGRAVLPADGWYEWTGLPRQKQPWYIRLESGQPLFLAAITDHQPDRPPREGTGFVIVTAAAEGGMVDVHDRRPVVFSAEDALLWMDCSLPPEQAEQLARARSLPPESFVWYPVSKEVNKAGNNRADLIEPIAL